MVDHEKWDRIRKRTRAILKTCKEKEGKLIVVDFKKQKVVRVMKLIKSK